MVLLFMSSAKLRKISVTIGEVLRIGAGCKLLFSTRVMKKVRQSGMAVAVRTSILACCVPAMKAAIYWWKKIIHDKQRDAIGALQLRRYKNRPTRTGCG